MSSLAAVNEWMSSAIYKNRFMAYSFLLILLMLLFTKLTVPLTTQQGLFLFSTGAAKMSVIVTSASNVWLCSITALLRLLKAYEINYQHLRISNNIYFECTHFDFLPLNFAGKACSDAPIFVKFRIARACWHNMRLDEDSDGSSQAICTLATSSGYGLWSIATRLISIFHTSQQNCGCFSNAQRRTYLAVITVAVTR